MQNEATQNRYVTLLYPHHVKHPQARHTYHTDLPSTLDLTHFMNLIGRSHQLRDDYQNLASQDVSHLTATPDTSYKEG